MKLTKLSHSPSLPLVIEPQGDHSLVGLQQWLQTHQAEVDKQLLDHGAILFRGFAVDTAQDFEDIALTIEPDLKRDYLGTSPRDAVTKYVFSASELPGYYPIPEHCEMTFLQNPPNRIFFSCLIEPQLGGGETPLVDFRKVYAALDPDVRDRFVEKGVRIVRNYTGPADKRKLDLFQLKRWHEMFMTTDKNIVEQKCAEQGFQAEWLDDDRLRLISQHDAMKPHPESGVPVWFNHLQVFHVSTAVAEFKRLHAYRPTLRTWGLIKFTQALTWFKERQANDDQAMQCTYNDGTDIPAADIEHVRDVIWQHMVIFPWKKGDIVALDNHSVAHGRLPYTGPRKVVVAWS